MEKKKKIKTLLITLFLIVIIAAIIVAGYILFRPSTNNISTQNITNEADKYFVAQTAIFNEDYSKNYNGVYKFSRVNFVDLSKLSEDAINLIYQNYKVNSTMGLISSLISEKKSNIKTTNEVLIIEDGRFQFNHNSSPYLIGSIYGNDDLSVFYNESNKKLFSASLTTLSEAELKNINSSETIEYFGDEIYITINIELMINKQPYNFDAVYVYKIQK